MFIHQSQLRHLLRPEQYVSDDQYRTELRDLFLPAWHPVAAAVELPRPGDFLTITILDRPLLLRNVDGRIRAFLNTCPHRHSQLTAKSRGYSERFHCQYHGWEFTADGRSAKIPDARAFRPWDRDNSSLKAFPTEQCGGVVFVKLTDGGPTLREFLAPVWELWSSGFSPPYHHAATWEGEFECNWKVVLENSLESYHIPEVHPKTFKEFPAEPACDHDLHPTYSTFRTPTPPDYVAKIQKWITRRLNRPVTGTYTHQVFHPHITFNQLDVYRMVQCVFPTGPRSCRYRNILFTLRGDGLNPFARLIGWALRPLVVYSAKTIYKEDAAIYETIQKGLNVSPHRGVLGTREERLYVFQQFVLDRCGQTPGPDPAAATDCGGCDGTKTGCGSIP